MRRVDLNDAAVFEDAYFVILTRLGLQYTTASTLDKRLPSTPYNGPVVMVIPLLSAHLVWGGIVFSEIVVT
jgi:hypothetical protein